MNREKRTLINLAQCDNRENKTRSILIVISIALTTMLLTALSLVINNEGKSRKINAGLNSGAFCGYFSNVEESDLANIRLRSEFTKIGLMSQAGMVKSESADLALYYSDETTVMMMGSNNNLAEGKFPEAEDEITAPKAFFQALGYENPKLGDRIQLESRIDDDHKFEPQEFVIAGFSKSNDRMDTSKFFGAFISETFFKKAVPSDLISYTVYFDLKDSYPVNTSNYKKTMQELAEKCGIDPKYAQANTLYLIFTKEPPMDFIGGGIIIGLAIIFFSVIVIYNIFQVGLVQKVQEYGKMKALGATRRQMKKVILREGMSLAVIGIPIGWMLGYLVSLLFNVWMNAYATEEKKMEGYVSVGMFSLPMLLLVVAVVMLTVYIALRKPMKVVAKISPVQAIRFQDSKLSRKGYRKGKQELSVSSMTLANMKSNQKRTVSTIMTLGLSCVLFVIMANLTSNIDYKYEARKKVEYGQFLVEFDYRLSDTAYPENNMDQVQPTEPISDAFIEKVQKISGVTQVRTRKVLCSRNITQENTRLMTIAVLSREEFARYKKQGKYLGNVDYDEVSRQDGILYSSIRFMEEYGYKIGEEDTFPLQVNGKTINFKTQLMGCFKDVEEDWVISEDTFERLGIKENLNTYLWVDCAENDCTKVREELESLTDQNKNLKLVSYSDEIKMNKMMMLFTKLLADAFLLIIGIIGFMNMANTMITSIITRKRELGILQAIGMTNHQLNYMLQLEGLLFTVGTVLVAAGVGSPIGYFIFQWGKSRGFVGLYIYHFPWIDLLCMAVAIGLLQTILSYVLSRNLRKDSLVERISYMG